MSKLHDEYLNVKQENSPDINTLVFDPKYWDSIMSNIEDMNFEKLSLIYPGYTFIEVPYNDDYFAMAINNGNPQICKFLKTKKISDTQWEVTQDIKECDEVRCPAKYDKVMEELIYILTNRK